MHVWLSPCPSVAWRCLADFSFPISTNKGPLPGVNCLQFSTIAYKQGLPKHQTEVSSIILQSLMSCNWLHHNNVKHVEAHTTGMSSQMNKTADHSGCIAYGTPSLHTAYSVADAVWTDKAQDMPMTTTAQPALMNERCCLCM